MALEREHAGVGIRTATRFARTLSELKRNGCNLLVVGGDHEPTRSEACRRLLGCGGAEPRRRVVVSADASVATVQERLPVASATPDDERDAIIDWETPTRSVSTTTGTPESVETVHVGADDLPGLGIEIHDRLADEAGASDPGHVRLCFDSLTPLLARYDHETVFRFLHLVTRCVDRVDGMGHYHLPVGRNAEATRLVAPLFDAIVELRTEAGRPEQRWHLPEEELTTDWLHV